MNVAAGQSDEPHKFNLENIIDRTRKLWNNTPTPVKSCFPWNRALDNFVQLILDIVLTVTKYLYVPVLIVTSIIELFYCAHERKLYITLFPFLFGVAIAGILNSAAMDCGQKMLECRSSFAFDCHWPFGLFFTLLKLPGPYYPYWGLIFIPHFANGALFRTLCLAFRWYRRPRKSLEKAMPDSIVMLCSNLHYMM
ncbi:uncharacterized protein LOC107808255 [Nicotiana tabacum]|uniref:Uncharacterized protein LOC107808255 n=1 Tax=Nicotiana tabacum TaxID=4097 RepID=A0AC58T393_TOBAC